LYELGLTGMALSGWIPLFTLWCIKHLFRQGTAFVVGRTSWLSAILEQTYFSQRQTTIV